MSRALVAAVVARSRVTTERSAVVNVTGDNKVDEGSDAECVVFSSA